MCKVNWCSLCLKLRKCVNINWKINFHWTKERGFCLLISEDSACRIHTWFHSPILISPPLVGGFQRIEKGSRGERVSLVSQCICEWSWYTGCDLWESHLRSYSSTPAPHLSLSRPVSFSLSPQMRWDRWETYWNFALPNPSCQTAEFCSDTTLASCLSFKTSMSVRCVPINLRDHAKLRLPSPPHSWMFSETLNYIHGTPEQTSACAPQWPYSNKIQFYPHADAGLE